MRQREQPYDTSGERNAELAAVPSMNSILLERGRDMDLSLYRPLMTAQEVQDVFGAAGPLQAIIELPVDGAVAPVPEVYEQRDKRRAATSIFIFLDSAPGEPARYRLMGTQQLRSLRNHAPVPLSETGIAPLMLEKGESIAVGRQRFREDELGRRVAVGETKWLPDEGFAADLKAQGPDRAALYGWISNHQARITVSDEGALQIFDDHSKNGTSVLYNAELVVPDDWAYELGKYSVSPLVSSGVEQ